MFYFARFLKLTTLPVVGFFWFSIHLTNPSSVNHPQQIPLR
jgi:hypothetical protein